MGLGGISVWQLLILLVIVLLLFGTKRLRNLGSDLGSAVKGFKKGLSDEEQAAEDEPRLEADPPATDSAESASRQSHNER